MTKIAFFDTVFLFEYGEASRPAAYLINHKFVHQRGRRQGGLRHETSRIPLRRKFGTAVPWPYESGILVRDARRLWEQDFAPSAVA